MGLRVTTLSRVLGINHKFSKTAYENIMSVMEAFLHLLYYLVHYGSRGLGGESRVVRYLFYNTVLGNSHVQTLTPVIYDTPGESGKMVAERELDLTKKTTKRKAKILN